MQYSLVLLLTSMIGNEVKFLSRLFGDGQREVARAQMSEPAPLIQPTKTIDADKFIDEVTTLNRQLEALFAEERNSEAILQAHRTVAFVEETLGPDHPVAADLLAWIGQILEKNGAKAEAEALYLHALASLEKTSSPDNHKLTQVVTKLAWLYARQDRYADAEKYFKRSLAIAEAEHGPDSGIVSLALRNLANVYKSQGRIADADLLFDRIFAIREKNRSQ
jgi:tetratricopeptide (TPR) repeat protein